MDSFSYNATPSPTFPEQPPAKKRLSSNAKIILIVFLCLAIFINSFIIGINVPTGAVREVQNIYKDLDGTDKFVTMRVVEESDPRVTTSLLFDRHLFSPSEITVMGALGTSGLIILAGIVMQEDVYTWRIEATYDDMEYGSGTKKGMQHLTYSGTIIPSTFHEKSRLTITEKEYSTPLPMKVDDMLLNEFGPLLMAQALDDLNAIMRLESSYGVRDLGFKQF